MKKVLFATVAAAVVAAPILVLAFAPAPDAGSHPVEYKACHGYAESHDSALQGDASFLALTSKTEFARIFDPVLTPRGAPDPVAKDAFDTRLFVAVIKRGDGLWDYKVEKVTANGDTLTVQYSATPHKGGAFHRGETLRERPRDTLKAARAGTTGKAITTARAATTEKAPTATQKGETKAAKGETKRADRPMATGAAAHTTEKGYATTERTRGPSTTFDSPLILSVPKDKYLTVVFIENGRKVGTARTGN